MGENLTIWWQACKEFGQYEEKCSYNLPPIKRKKELLETFSG